MFEDVTLVCSMCVRNVVCLNVCHDFNVKCVHPLSVLTLSPLSSSLLGCIHASISGFCFFSFAPCVSLCAHLSPSPADGASHLTGTDYNHLRKVEMEECYNLSPSLIAAICCSSSLEELVVTSQVSVLSVCPTNVAISYAYKLLSIVTNCPSKPCTYICLAALNG